MRPLLVLLLLPPAGPLLLIALAAALQRWWRPARYGVALGLALLWALSAEAVTEPLGRWWAGVPSTAASLQQLDALRGRSDTVVLVLGGGLARGMALDGGFDLRLETAERLRRGVSWSRRLGLPLAFSGGVSSVNPDNPSEASVAAQVAREVYRHPLAWAEARSSSTRENAQFSAPLLGQLGVKRVLLVTHGEHMPRALRAFRAAAPQVAFEPAALARDGVARQSWATYLPSAEGVRRGRYLVYELLAYAAGR